MRCPACGHENDPDRPFCAGCAAELELGAAADFEPPRARNRRHRRLQAIAQHMERAWSDLGYAYRRRRPQHADLVANLRHVALVLAALLPGLGHQLLGRRQDALRLMTGFVISILTWWFLMGAALGTLSGVAAASFMAASVADCMRLRPDGGRGRFSPGRALYAIAMVCAVYALATWAFSLRWERVAVTQPVLQVVPPGAPRPETPVFHEGDRLLVRKQAYRHSRPARGDVVLARVNDLDSLQRILGEPGDYVEFSEGQLWVNGDALDPRRYPLQPEQPAVGAHLQTRPWSGTLGRDQYLVWGVQGEGHDPHAGLGPVRIQRPDVMGRVWAVYAPYRHRHIIGHASTPLAQE